MNELFAIAEDVASTSEYSEILTSIYNELVNLNASLEVIQTTSTFAMAILAGSLCGACCAYFIGKLLRTR